ncbi:hypothetical protein H6P81_016679 [Aristolochia fimbriata]|uniref:Uncharacterized protein n=1 Tax=Aristolochia fimbriata TaxID=158543 RepID=A0AAV7E9E6_ARIFI|nr:hypothetical protein H6P81_016679 [Aristolochia fimbriata]
MATEKARKGRKRDLAFAAGRKVTSFLNPSYSRKKAAPGRRRGEGEAVKTRGGRQSDSREMDWGEDTSGRRGEGWVRGGGGEDRDSSPAKRQTLT